ncbi:MAG: MFS transporter [Solirubrobacteraceae bacterium]
MLSRYAGVLRAPHVRALVSASIVARIPIGMLGLALVLFVEDVKGSYAPAGAVTAAFALSAALLAAAEGRLIDRRGQTVVLLAGASVSVAAFVALVVLGLRGAPTGVLVGCAVVGGTMPPVSACLRPLWPRLLDRELVTAAYALDSILIEVVFVIGPLLAGLLIALFSPEAAILVSTGLMLAGCTWFASLEPSRRWRGEPATSSHLLGALVAPGIRTLVVGSLAVGVCFGTLEVALAAYGNDRGSGSLGGVLIALQAIGSAAGGLWYGVRGDRLGPLHVGYLGLLTAVPPLVALLAAAPTLGTLVPLAILSGCVVAPLSAAGNLLASSLAPAGTLTEAFTWVITAIVAGTAAGNAMAGLVIDASSWRVAVLAACGTTLVGVAATAARRATLRMA